MGSLSLVQPEERARIRSGPSDWTESGASYALHEEREAYGLNLGNESETLTARLGSGDFLDPFGQKDGTRAVILATERCDDRSCPAISHRRPCTGPVSEPARRAAPALRIPSSFRNPLT